MLLLKLWWVCAAVDSVLRALAKDLHTDLIILASIIFKRFLEYLQSPSVEIRMNNDWDQGPKIYTMQIKPSHEVYADLIKL